MLQVEQFGEMGQFILSDTGHTRYFRVSRNPWGLENGLPHEIDTIDGPRPARILATVAYVSIDEDECGKPVIEKWAIRRCHKYPCYEEKAK